MTTPEFLAAFEAATQRIVETVKRKNADYAGESADPFYNFRLIETYSKGAISAEAGILVRKSDKLSRMMVLLDKEASVKDESFEDTCYDDAAYSIILALVHQSRKSVA